MRDVHSAPPPDSGEGGGGDPLIRPTAGGLRKKGAWARAWLLVGSKGQAEVVEAGRNAIMQRTGLPARDLRMLDPALSYPSTVLGRERAIVVNLEHIKSIITSQEMIFQNSKDPLLTPFIQKIQGIFRHRQAVMLSQESGGEANKGVWTDFYNSDQEPQSDGSDRIYTGLFHDKNEEGNAGGGQQVGDSAHGLKLLPFEFVALEACLDATCSSLDDEARRLEQEAHPALDKLTSKISTHNLDRVRHIKSRLVTITGRVQKVRDELEHLLDDDEDMAEMYLTEKLEEQKLESSSTSSMKDQDIIDEEDKTDVEIMSGLQRSSTASDIGVPKANIELERSLDESNSLRRESNRSHASTQSYSTMIVDVEELEMILEAYFVQIEGTLNKLSTLREYVDDTEDYINIMLDDKQNHLLQMGVVLTTATLVVSAFVALTGVFGMNVGIELFNPDKAGMPDFLWTVGGGAIACTVCYVAAIAWCRYQRLLEY